MTLTSENAQIIGREFLRVSYDRSGIERSPEEQHDDHEETAEERGVRLHSEPYREVASASKYARKARKEYERLIADLVADRFGAHELWLWEGSRGSRQVKEWLYLLELCVQRMVKIYVHTRRRLFDPANEYDWADLLSDAIKHELSSVDTSKRALRTQRKGAAVGRAHGRVPFGYRREYWAETVGGKLVKKFRQVINEAEAPLVRELFARFRRGHSLRSIALDWEARGVRNDSGRPFSPAHLRALLENPAYAGRRVHDPNRKGRKTSPSLTVTTGQWPALVPAAMFDATQRVLTDPSRRTNRPGRGVHLLSMIGLCDSCGGPLAARWRREKAKRGRKAIEEQEYTCHRTGCTRIIYIELNDYAEQVVWAYLEREDVYAGLMTADEANAEALEAAEAKVERIRLEMREIERQVEALEMPSASAGRMLVNLDTRLREAEARATELRVPSRLAGLIEPGPDVRTRWKDAPMSTRRETVKMLFSPELLGELRVQRAPRTGSVRTPVEQRVIWCRTDSAQSLMPSPQ